MRIAMALLTLALTVSACKKKESKPTADTTGSAPAGSAVVADAAAAAEMGSAMPDAADAATTMTKKAGNCPSTVFSATTKAEVKGKDVVVTVTSDDKDAIATIQRRAEELVGEKKDAPGAGGGHDQKGTHGGGAGVCPVHMPEGATATFAKDPKGAVVTITPKDKPDALKAEIDARITRATEWMKENVKAGEKGTQGGVGGGKGEHGGNHSGQGDAKGVERKGSGADTGGGGGKGTGGGGGKGTGGGGGH